MKSFLTSSLALALSLNVFGQGSVVFNNYISGSVNAPVKRPDGSGAGSGITAQLVMVTSNGEVVPFTPKTTFRTSSAAATYYVNPTVATVAGKGPGSTVTLRMRAYNGSDFSSSTLRGESSDIQVTLGGNLTVPPDLIGLQGFTLSSGAIAPAITTQPLSQVAALGSSVTLRVVASGSNPLSYQWLWNGNTIVGATAASLNLTALKESNSGRYKVVVKNGAGSVTSQEAVLRIIAPPQIVTAVQDQTALQGGTATFSVQATGTSLQYQWQWDGVNITGATSSVLKLTNVQATDAGTYSVTISNDLGKLTSAGKLTVSSASFVKRQLPNGYSAGAKLVVTLVATPPTQTLAYLVSDQFPAGWTIGTISENGVYDAVNKKVKFGPFLDSSVRSLSYEVTPPLQASGAAHFIGSAVADGVPTPVAGDETIELINLHPADNSPADQRMTDVELTAYATAWKRGDKWPQGPNPIPASYVSRAGTLWRGGESYHVDPAVASGAPLWWVNTTPVAARPAIAGDAPQAPLDSLSTRLTNGLFSAGMPAQYVPGFSINVVSAVVPPAETASYVVEEVVPEGWTVSNINENGQFDATSHTVKWGLFFDAAIRKLSFDLLAPTNSSAEISLNGTASFDGADFALTGSTQSVASSKLHRPQHNPSGWIDLDLNGVVGRDYAIQESTDLVNWTTIKTFRNLNGLIHYAESQAQPLRQKFYRAVLVP